MNITSNDLQLENRIFNIRNKQVMIDRDLAELYQVVVKRLNEQVKRNIERFPPNFRFQLNDSETLELVAKCDRLKSLKHSSSNPFVFTEQGVAMLSAVLKSKTAIQISIEIMTGFIELRKEIPNLGTLHHRIAHLELKIKDSDFKFEKVFKALEGNKIPTQGVFFEGQVFDAYELTSRIIRKAKKSIILIDNYIDERTLVHLSKKEKSVIVTLLSIDKSAQLDLDLQKANTQYGNFTWKKFSKSHDRFLIIDQNEVYHLGASLKDLGKKWFAFTLLKPQSISELLKKINDEIYLKP